MRRTLELVLGPALLFLVARALGSTALTATAVGLGIVYFGCWYALVLASERLVVTRRPSGTETLENAPLEMEFVVSGLRRLPVHLEILGASGRWTKLPWGVSVLEYRFGHPGQFDIASPLRLQDDLGLLTRSVPAGDPETVLVLPRPERPVGQIVRAGALDAAQDPEPDGLRPYVPGTPMSRIHWPSAARGGELQERVFTSQRDHLPLVVVDTAGARSDEAVDWAARQAAGQVLALSLGGGCRVLLPGDRSPSTLTGVPSQWARLHRRLATLAVGAPAAAPGVDLRGAVLVRAAAAPATDLRSREDLTPGVTQAAAPVFT